MIALQTVMATFQTEIVQVTRHGILPTVIGGPGGSAACRPLIAQMLINLTELAETPVSSWLSAQITITTDITNTRMRLADPNSIEITETVIVGIAAGIALLDSTVARIATAIVIATVTAEVCR